MSLRNVLALALLFQVVVQTRSTLSGDDSAENQKIFDAFEQRINIAIRLREYIRVKNNPTVARGTDSEGRNVYTVTNIEMFTTTCDKSVGLDNTPEEKRSQCTFGESSFLAGTYHATVIKEGDQYRVDSWAPGAQ